MDATSDRDDVERQAARKRVEKRRALQGGLVAYVVVNGFLVIAWSLTGGGYFWPGWILAGWGIGMVLGVWDYLRGPVTEADVDRELEGSSRARLSADRRIDEVSNQTDRTGGEGRDGDRDR